MRGLLKSHILGSVGFAAAGYVLITRPCNSVEDFFHLHSIGQAFFSPYFAAFAFFMAFALFGLIAADGLSFVTAWGIANRRSWARWTGILPCLYLLAGFPYLTVFGLLGLWFLWKQPAPQRAPLTAGEFWNRRRQSGWMFAACLIGWFVSRAAFDGLTVNAYLRGLPIESAHIGLPVLLLLLWAHIALHECGHAVAAAAVGSELQSLAVGPFVFSKESGRLRVRFEWRALLLIGGYTRAIPATGPRLREREMFVVAAGPLVSLVTGGVLLAGFHWLPKTVLATLWPVIAMGSVVGIYIAVVSMLPLGYCDGTMFFHLLFRTRRGEELLSRIRQGTTSDNSGQPATTYDDDIARWKDALEHYLNTPDTTPVQLGSTYIGLAAVELAAQRLQDAEQHLKQGLALLPEGASPASEASAWACLQILRAGRQDQAGAAEAGETALRAARLFQSQAVDPVERVRAASTIAYVHTHSHNWAAVLETTEAALAICPADWKGVLLRYRVQALLQTGCIDDGLRALKEAASILREQTENSAGAHNLGLLGEALWQAGRTEDAIAMVTETIQLLEPRGAKRLALPFRLFLADILRLQGQVARAACVLPPPDAVDPDQRKRYLEQRGRIRRSAGKLPEAISDFSAAAALEEAEADPVQLAVARAKLADVLAEAGDLERAEPMVLQAAEILQAAGHPDFGATSITLAVIAARTNQPAGEHVSAAIRAWDAAGLLLPADKARELEAAAKLLEAAGLAAEASDCRTAAGRYWRMLAPSSSQSGASVTHAVPSVQPRTVPLTP